MIVLVLLILVLALIALMILISGIPSNKVRYTDEEMRLALLYYNVNVCFDLENEGGRRIVMCMAYLAERLGYSVYDDDFRYSGGCHILKESIENGCGGGVNFQFDGHCPFSWVVAVTAADIRGHLLDGHHDFIGVEISDNDRKKIEELKSIIEEKPACGTLADWLSLISSIDYLFNRLLNDVAVYDFMINNSKLERDVLIQNYPAAHLTWEKCFMKPLEMTGICYKAMDAHGRNL